jgi:hypothetical protein
MVFIRCGSALGHVLVGWTPMAPGPLGMYAFSIPGGDRGAHICISSVPALGLHALIEEEE